MESPKGAFAAIAPEKKAAAARLNHDRARSDGRAMPCFGQIMAQSGQGTDGF
jgi:hypothetical protein